MSDIYSVSEPNAPPPDNGFDALEALRGALTRLTPAGAALDLFLIALIVIGIYFRFNWANWNQDTDLHPDEYGLTSTLTQLAVPKSIGDYFNTRLSPLSPYQKYDRAGNPLEPSAENRMPDNRMRWGQWPIIIIRWTAELTDNTGYGDLRLWGRKLSALFDSLSLAVIFLFGWRLYRNYRIGLLAAALSALAVMQIQQSHFMTADNFATLFTALAMLCATFVARPPKIDGWFGLPSVWYALFGVFFGMALASRINLLPLFGLILVAAVIAYAERWEKGDRAKVVSEVLLRLALAGVVALLTFRITSPMSFRARTGDTTFLTLTPNKEWVESMALASAESSGASPGGPPGEQWTNRPAIVFPLVNMVVWGMGLPLGLLAWAGFLWALWRAVRPGDEWKAHALPLVWAGGYFLFMGTRWVKSVRYFLSIYPFLALFAAWAVFELWRLAENRRQKTEDRRQTAENSRPISFFILPTSVFLIVTLGTLAWAWGFTSIYRTDNTRIQASRWIYQNVPAAINLHFQQADGQPYNDPISGLDGTVFDAADPVSFPFRARVTGTLTGLSFAHIRNANDGTLDAMMHVSVSRDADGAQILAEGDVPVGVVGRDPRGDAAQATFGPTAVTAGETYYLRLSVAQGGAAQITSSMLAIESWDEGLPLRLDNRDAYGGLYRGLIMEVRWGDDEHKRQMFLDDLAQVDYVVLPSQRAVWSSGRLPNNYPLTMEYYRALFDGRLGFDLVKQFQSPFILGPLQASDVAGTFAWGQTPPLPPPGKDFPFNNNWLAAEEAFSVYDHAPVWVFRKRPDFDIENARALLNAIDLSTVVNQDPVSATKAPTLLMLPADRLAEQQAGGTWRAMFNPQSWLNQHEWLGVIVWWLAIMLLGWLAFPLTHAAFGGLADRGYALSRTVALVVVAWLAWMLGSFRLLPFTQLTIALCVLALALVSGFIAWRREDELRAFIREQRRHILTVEAILLALFLFDLLIRWGNPDLWHPNFGGERPMVFSFFNAVLKSTSFPPYNPWMSGAFLNYYYYGFVIVSVPVKLLGIVPSFAFNLILPTLFALTGINAFGIAYNLIGSRKSEVGSQSAPETPLTSDLQPPTSNLSLPAKPNPYLAGIAAALLVVVLGNLGQVYTLMGGFEKAGDRAAFAGTPIGSGSVSAILDGAAKVFSGKALIPIGTGDWYWTASRVVGYINKSSDITEFPFFTFLYSDLHAHMIDMPLVLLALAWAVSYLLDKRPKRWPIESAALWAVGGLALGVTNPTNTWDFPTYLGLGLVAVVAAHFLRSPRLTRASLFALAWRLALLLGLAVGLYRPFEQWFAPAYSAFKRNLDTYATNSGYLYMFGLFLFILVAFLMWETRRWLAETPATVVTRAGDWLPWLALVLVAVVVSVAALWYLHVQIGLIVLPLMAWAGLLLLRPPSAMPAEKQVILFLIGTALAVTLFVELFLVGGDRMNTIFKFYIQAWLLFSVAGGAALALVWAALPQWPGFWRSVWQVGLSVLVAAAALYTVTAANAKIHDRYPQYTAQPTGVENPGCQQIPGVPMPATYTNDQSWAVKDQPHTLDSAAYMTWSAYCDNTYFVPLAYDADAIRWMQENVDGSPTILEANTVEYRWGNRFTIYTGLPGVVGWSYHTRQHRGIVSTVMVTDRVDEVREFYCTPTLTGGIVGDTINLPELCRIPVDYATIDYNWAVNFLQKYNVRYVIVGAYERAIFPAEGLQKFDVLQAHGVLTPVYQNPGTIIYQVNGN